MVGRAMHLQEFCDSPVSICCHCHQLLSDKVKPGVVGAEGADWVRCFPIISSSLWFYSCLCESSTVNYEYLKGCGIAGIAVKQHWEKSQSGLGKEASSTFLHGSSVQSCTAVLVIVTKCQQTKWSIINILERKSQGYSKPGIQPQIF